MSEAKYTKGPWIRMDNDINVWSPSGAVCQRPKIKDGMSSARNWEANARLISAAPELLEALQEIVAAADGEGWSQLDATLAKARSAIDKALGAANAD